MSQVNNFHRAFFALTIGMSTQEDHQNHAIIAVAATFMTLAFITVVLRCYVRLRLVKAFGWDDGSMVVAMVSHESLRSKWCLVEDSNVLIKTKAWYIMFSASMIGAGLHGNGRHWYNVEAEERVIAMKVCQAC